MKEIVLFGTGISAEKFIFECGSDFDIKYVLDFKKYSRKFLGKYDVYEPTKENCSKYFIVVAGDYYRSKIIPFFKQMGKEELVDYIWYEWNEKEIVIINANCYGPHIKKYLQADDDFTKSFCFYPVPTICENHAGTIDENIIKRCSVFIHQDIKPDNAFGYKLSDEYLLKQIPSNTKTITIPNLVGFGSAFYPQSESSNMRSRPFPNAANGLFPHADKILDSMCIQGDTLCKIINKCRNTRILKKSEIIDGLNNSYKKFKKREENWDIKVVDMIMDLHRDTKVFYDKVHPANFIIRNICEEILNKLGIHKKLNLLGNGINAYENPVYPDVKEYLKLSWGGYEEKIRQGSPFKLTKGEMNTEEYIREYVFWCYLDKYYDEI